MIPQNQLLAQLLLREAGERRCRVRKLTSTSAAPLGADPAVPPAQATEEEAPEHVQMDCMVNKNLGNTGFCTQ